MALGFATREETDNHMWVARSDVVLAALAMAVA
jgi:hypothetical protein